MLKKAFVYITDWTSPLRCSTVIRACHYIILEWLKYLICRSQIETISFSLDGCEQVNQ